MMKEFVFFPTLICFRIFSFQKDIKNYVEWLLCTNFLPCKDASIITEWSEGELEHLLETTISLHTRTHSSFDWMLKLCIRSIQQKSQQEWRRVPWSFTLPENLLISDSCWRRRRQLSSGTWDDGTHASVDALHLCTRSEDKVS